MTPSVVRVHVINLTPGSDNPYLGGAEGEAHAPGARREVLGHRGLDHLDVAAPVDPFESKGLKSGFLAS
jgi:hypothetical protein